MTPDEQLRWACPNCHTVNIDYSTQDSPLPDNVLCEDCGQWFWSGDLDNLNPLEVSA